MPDQAMNVQAAPERVTAIEMVASIAHESFGLGYAALHLSAALARAGANVFLVTVDPARVAYEACEDAGFPRDRLIRGALIGPARLRFSPLLLRELSKIPADDRTIAHLHGMWTYVSHVAGAFRTRSRCPLVLSPHGSLEPYALSVSPRKKAIASLLYERRNIATASCIWALSEQEESSIRSVGFAGQVAVIPNGVRPAEPPGAAEIAEFRTRHGLDGAGRILLFLSRIAVKKNLPLLLKALKINLRLHPGWTLVIAGSDEKGHLREVGSLIQLLDMERSVRLIGDVSGKEKACALHTASLFVLPSHSEGLPIAVLEAMEYGKPVLVTDGWTLPVATNLSFGWRASTEERAFEHALADAMSSSEDTLAEMGRNAKAIVREHFDWDSAAAQAIRLYRGLLANRREFAGLAPMNGILGPTDCDRRKTRQQKAVQP